MNITQQREIWKEKHARNWEEQERKKKHVIITTNIDVVGLYCACYETIQESF